MLCSNSLNSLNNNFFASLFAVSFASSVMFCIKDIASVLASAFSAFTSSSLATSAFKLDIVSKAFTCLAWAFSSSFSFFSRASNFWLIFSLFFSTSLDFSLLLLAADLVQNLYLLLLFQAQIFFDYARLLLFHAHF